MQGTSTFFSIINAFCKMLDTIPHDQAFTQLIITQMVTYYDKCFGWYKGNTSRASASPKLSLKMPALVTRADGQAQGGIRLKTAAALAEAGKIRDVITKQWQAEAGELHDLLENVCLWLNLSSHRLTR